MKNPCLEPNLRLFVHKTQPVQDVEQGDAYIFAGAVHGAVEKHYLTLVNVKPNRVLDLGVFKTKGERHSHHPMLLGLEV